MSDSGIAGEVFKQYQRALRMFREAVMAFPADEWRQGDISYLRPAGVAYHVLECTDLYTGNKSVEEFAWGGRFDADWEDANSDQLPSQEQLIIYLDEMEDKLEEWFRKADLLAVETVFPWTGQLILGRAIYNSRHIQHHLSEMSLELTRRGYQSPEWR